MGVITRIEHYIWYLHGAYSQVADQARHYMWWLKNMEVILSTAVFSVSSVSPPPGDALRIRQHPSRCRPREDDERKGCSQ